MIEKHGIVRNPRGLHCRPASIIFKAMKGFKGVITITNEDGESVQLRGALSIISLAMIGGSSFTIRVDGEDEELVSEQLLKMLEDIYEFDD